MDVVKAFEQASGKEIKYEIVARRAGDVASSYATCDTVSKELGWNAKLNLQDMCKQLQQPLCFFY